MIQISFIEKTIYTICFIVAFPIVKIMHIKHEIQKKYFNK